MKTILSRIGRIFLLLFILSALIVRAENAPTSPPEGTVAVLHISSLQQLTDSVTGFLGSALQTKIDLDIEDLIGSPFDLENLDGVDREKPILAFYLEPKEEGEEGSLIGFYPVSDEKAFLAQFGDLETVKEGIFDTGKLRLSSSKGYVAIAKKDEAEIVTDWLDQGGDAAALAAQASPVQGDVWAHVYFEKVADKYKEAIEEIRKGYLESQKQASEQAPNAQEMVSYQMEGLMGLVDAVQSLDLGISADAEALKISKLVHPKVGSTLAKFVETHQPKSAVEVKKLVTADAIVSILANVSTQQDWAFEMQKVFSGMPPVLTEKDRELMKICQEATNGAQLTQFEINNDPDNPIVINSAVSVVDAEQGQRLLENTLDWLESNFREGKTLIELEVKGKTGELNGSPIQTYTLKPKGSDDPEAEAPKTLNFLTGEKTVNNVVTQGVQMTSTGDLRELADRLENPEPDLTWPTEPDMESMLAVRINLFQMLKGAQKATAKSEGINPLALFKLPSEVDMQGVTLNLKKSDQNLLGTLTIPAKDIRKLESIVTGQMK